MGSLRTIPGINAGVATEVREISFQIPANSNIGILGGIGTDAVIEEVLFRGAARPTVASFIRLWRHRSNSTAVDNGAVSSGSVAAAQWITDGYATGTGTGTGLGNGATGATGTPATKSTMRATLTAASSGSNSGVAPQNNVLYASDLIGYQCSTDSAGATGGALTGSVGVTVIIRYREIDISKLTGVSNANYVDG
jgi:hypothetical protein